MRQKTVIKMLLHSAAEVYCKVFQVLQNLSGIIKCDRLLFQNASGITKCARYLQSATVITKWGVTPLVWPKCISLVRSIGKGQEIITVLELLRDQTGYFWTAATVYHNL